jgi:putative addiction module component (TIGR02574 family)
MTKDAEQVLQQAMGLDASDRVELADRLWETLESEDGLSSDPPYTAAWEAEIRRRLAAIDTGESTSIPLEQGREHLLRAGADGQLGQADE